MKTEGFQSVKGPGQNPAQEEIVCKDLRTLHKFDFYELAFERLKTTKLVNRGPHPNFRRYRDCRIRLQQQFHVSREDCGRILVDLRNMGKIKFKRHGILLLDGEGSK